MRCAISRRALLGLTFSSFLIGAPTVAGAQTSRNGPGMMGGGGGMMGGGGMVGGPWNSTRYLDALKGELGITASEEPAWKGYADTVSGVGQQMQGLHQTMFESMGTASWEQRRDMMNTMFEARQQAFDTVHEAAQKLLASLSEAQQAKARNILPGLVYGRGMMGGAGRGPGPGPR